ncbi:MAG TPA: uroporphyrinogen decarboxylase family protein [Candidatus Hydrogenedentes bacterium]|nr:uroporphyrinogen decarboxylase family protein [Candidatus Hydrogenedentota bacterium]HOL75996.1 uroporphyrinogen decarboxylase family protein [Candidatus Hydrogenedentota bacterium]HPO85838.1 uroporphyrinogen decarboxylase family protein [Candidatus Hydrogenedentota bacterium]
MKLFRLEDRTREDFAAHNEQAKALWADFHARRHLRVPVRFNTNPRILLLNPEYNVRNISYEAYMTDPETMWNVQLEWQYWVRYYLPGDHEKGLPDCWTVNIDFQNFYDAAWFGCPVHYRERQVPDTLPILGNGKKYLLFDRGLPEPFEGEWPQRALRYLELFKKKSESGASFLGRPVRFGGYLPFASSDGIFTLAASLRGATDLCTDLITDPDYVRELLKYICEALISRIKAWRHVLGIPEKIDGFGAADDAIELISTEAYEEFVLPFHVRYFDALGTDKNRGMHLCGDAQRHFVKIRDVLGVSQFDTGFPIDFSRLRRDLGPDVLVSGGPAAYNFLQDDTKVIEEETRRILRSGILEGGRFILQEGNNLPPCARLQNCETVYQTALREGRVSS